MRPAALPLLLPLVLAFLPACGQVPDAPETGPGEAPATPTVELVGPGPVSSELPEFAATLSPDGDTLWFNRTAADFSGIRLFWSVRGEDGWSEAVPFPPTDGMAAWDPFLDHLGRLWITSDRPRPDGSSGDLDLWTLERTAEGWGEPSLAPPPVSSDSAEVFNSMSREGLLVFASYRGDGVRRIWTSRETGGGFSEPRALDLGVGPQASNPAVSPDGTLLVLQVPVDGTPDLVVWCREGRGWRRGEPLGEPVNTRWAEFAPAMVGETLWFTSDRPGVVGERPDSVRPPGDLYRTDLVVARRACGEGG